MWIESLLCELHVKTNKKPTKWCENLSTVPLTANKISHSRTKHMELNLYFVREKVLQHRLDINHLPATYQRADVLTKPLSTKSFAQQRQWLKIEQITSNSSLEQPNIEIKTS